MTDITINQNWDDTRNQRLIIIYGDTPNDVINRNGQMDIVSSSNNEVSYYHAIYFNEHAKNNYQDDKAYQSYIDGMNKTLNPVIPIYLQNDKYNNIIFTETTRDGENDKYGIFYFPTNNPSNEQYKTLNQVLSNLTDYKKILVVGQPYIKNQVLDNKIIFSLAGEEILTLESKIKNEYLLENNDTKVIKRS